MSSWLMVSMTGSCWGRSCNSVLALSMRDGEKMNQADEQVNKEYVGIIWIGDGTGARLRVFAPSPLEARALVIEEYGEGHVITLRNEPDANRPR